MVGKAARRQRQDGERQRRARPEAAQLAERANRAASILLDQLEEHLSVVIGNGRRVRLDLGRWPTYRKWAQDVGYSWPSWSWIPYTTVLNMVHRDLGEALAPGVTLGDLEAVVAPVVPVLNWLPGRIAVRFDLDIVDTFTASPIGETIPTQALYRLPSWGLFLDCPWLAPGAGVFASIDPGHIDAPPGETPIDSTDELQLTFVLPDKQPPTLHTSLWFPEGTIAAALEAQDRQPVLPGVVSDHVHADRRTLSDCFGQPFPQVMATVVSMLLYLCVEDADIEQRPLPLKAPAVSYQRGQTDITVMEAGWRMGSALRSARARYGREDVGADPTGRHVTPHVRRAHWHSYWGGPRSLPREERTLLLYYLPPLHVGVPGDTLPQLTVVRDAD